MKWTLWYQKFWILKLLGVTFPKDPGALHILPQQLKSTKMLQGRDDNNMFALTLVMNRATITISKLLKNLPFHFFHSEMSNKYLLSIDFKVVQMNSPSKVKMASL